MERCLHCNGVLTSREKVCPACQTPLKKGSWSLGDTLQWLGRLIFYSASFAMLFTWLFPETFAFESVLIVCTVALTIFVRR
jgi:hypothetical protein